VAVLAHPGARTNAETATLSAATRERRLVFMGGEIGSRLFCGKPDFLSISLFPHKSPAANRNIQKNARPLTPNSFSARGTGQCARRNGFTKGRRPGKFNDGFSAHCVNKISRSD